MILFTARTLITRDVENLKYFGEVLGPKAEETLPLSKAREARNAVSRETGR